MKQLLEMIMGFFEEEMIKVENAELKEEDQVLANYVQEIDTSSQRPLRLPPKNPYRKRA
jgi:hypothetical protein